MEETTGNSQTNGNLFFYWSELHAYTRASQADKLTEATRTALTTAMQQAKAEHDANWATDATYEALQSAYNAAKNEVGEGSRLVDFAKSFYLTAYSDKALVVPTGVGYAGYFTETGHSHGHCDFSRKQFARPYHAAS